MRKLSTFQIISLILALLTLVGTMFYYFSNLRLAQKSPQQSLIIDLEKRIKEMEEFGIQSNSSLSFTKKLGEIYCKDFKDAEPLLTLTGFLRQKLDTISYGSDERLSVLKNLIEIIDYIDKNGCQDNQMIQHHEVIKGKRIFLVPKKNNVNVVEINSVDDAKFRFLTNEKYKYKLIRKYDLPSLIRNEEDFKYLSNEDYIISIKHYKNKKFLTSLQSNIFAKFFDTENNKFCTVYECDSNYGVCHDCY